MAATLGVSLCNLRANQQKIGCKAPSKISILNARNGVILGAVKQNGSNVRSISNDETELRSQLQNVDCQSTSAAPLKLLERLLATSNTLNGRAAWTLAVVLGATAVLGAAEPAMAATQDPHGYNVIGDVAENEEFWSNVLRYISYFFSVLLGTAYVAVKPLIELMKRPGTAVLVIAGTGLLFFFVSTTVSAMLGMNEIITYEPSSIVTPAL